MDQSSPTVVPFRSREQAREEAGEWIARLDRGLSESEHRDLEQWLAADGRNTDALLGLAALWDQTEILSGLATLFPLRRPERATRGRLAVAAAFAAVIAVGALVVFGIKPDSSPMPEVRHVYETAVGSQSTVELMDGSVVTLNTNSAMTVVFSESSRSITLGRGEGYFAVEPDPSRPFRVTAGSRVLEAVGTEFNVRIDPDDGLKLMVTEGRVDVSVDIGPNDELRESTSRPADAIVDAGTLAVVNHAGVSLVALNEAQMEPYLSWQQGMLMFDGETLDVVLNEMSRYTTMDLASDPSVGEVRVGGFFRAGDVDGLLIALRENFAIESIREPDGRVVLIPAQ